MNQQCKNDKKLEGQGQFWKKKGNKGTVFSGKDVSFTLSEKVNTTR
jgi:hypothetical protein